MIESATQGATPTRDNATTVDLDDLNQVNSMMQDVMTMLASGENKTQGKETTNVVQKEDKQEDKQEKQENVLEETTPEMKKSKEPEPNTETPEEEAPEQVDEGEPEDTLDKRVKDAQSMIGRQGNEIGQLRKQNAELLEKLTEVAKNLQPKVEEEPYYEKLRKASAEDVEKVLGPILREDPARLMQYVAQMTDDMLKDKLKPYQNLIEQAERTQQTAKLDKLWQKEHPGWEKRNPAIQEYIKKAYPNGLVDDKGNYIADPYQVAHVAYVAAGDAMEKVTKTVDSENNKRIVAGRSASTATTSVPSSRKSQPKPDSKAAEVDRVWATVENTLLTR